MNYIANMAQYVLFVPGNHEYYCPPNTRGVTKNMLSQYMFSALRSISTDRITYLDKGIFDIGNTRFIGATLWTDIPKNKHEIAAGMMNDYRLIPSDHTPGASITPADVSEMHSADRTWLKGRIADVNRMKGTRVVAVTHHVPTIKLAKRSATITREMERFYYCTDMEELFTPDCLQAWCCGHDHIDRVEAPYKNGPVFISNALGYPSYYNTGFNPLRIYSLMENR